MNTSNPITNPGVQFFGVTKQDPCLQCEPGGVCRTPTCGRLKAKNLEDFKTQPDPRDAVIAKLSIELETIKQTNIRMSNSMQTLLAAMEDARTSLQRYY